MQPRIEFLPPKKLVGKRVVTSLAEDKPWQLWQEFMPRRNEILHRVGLILYSVEIYDPLYFTHFNPHAEFEKWAAVEVSHFDTIPWGMDSLHLPGGLYAVFLHKGPASTASSTFEYIFQTWLPDAAFILDNRPHFEVMDHTYKHEAPDSQEEFWIPVQHKNTLNR